MFRIACIVTLLSCFPVAVVAEARHHLSYLYQADEQDTHSHIIDGFFSATDALGFSIGGGQSHVEDDADDITTTDWYAGFSYELSNSWELAYSYEAWGDGDFIDIMTHRMDVSFFSDDWSLSIAPEYQSIDVDFNEVDWVEVWGSRRRQTTLEQFLQLIGQRLSVLHAEYDGLETYGLSLSAAYYGFERAYLQASLSGYDYSRDVSEFDLGTAMSERMLSPSTYSAIDGLIDWRWGLTWGYFFDQSRLSLSWGYAVSAITQKGFNTYSAQTAFAVSEQSELLFELGVSDGGEGDSLFYGGLGLSHSF